MKSKVKCPNCNVKTTILSQQTGVAENGTPVIVFKVECPKCHMKGKITQVVDTDV